MVLTLMIWVLYLAVEPYVRRRWPHALIPWTRVLGGSFGDPRVGGDLLIGLATGAAMATDVARAGLGTASLRRAVPHMALRIGGTMTAVVVSGVRRLLEDGSA